MFDVDALLDGLEVELRNALNTAITGLVTTARTRLEGAIMELAKERTNGIVEVVEVRRAALAEVDARRGELAREVTAMQTHQEKQQGHVELNIGGYRFQTSVQTLRHVPHTFFDAYFSGRYAQDMCDDGSISVDRDGEHFGHILEYMRDGVVSVAEPGACPSVSLLRALKREFGFYCIELEAEQAAEPAQPEVAYVIGGHTGNGAGVGKLASMERYDASSGQWSAAAAMGTARSHFGTCVIAGEIYVTGGEANSTYFSSVEKYSPLSDTWSAVSPLPVARSSHAAVTVGSTMYVLGGLINDSVIDSVLKFDSTQDSWSQVAPMLAERSGAAACAIGSDIYVFGGAAARADFQATVFKFGTSTNEWSTLAPMQHTCYCHSVSLMAWSTSWVLGLACVLSCASTRCQVLQARSPLQ
jgi:hypothetical protein